jgi:glycosyltransferase involved in cell wall biosynthesis
MGDRLRTLKGIQSEARLPNVTFVDRVRDEDLEEFLSAANVWLIPYRKDVAGVSVPSRFYNLLAVGRPVILVSEPNAEAALTVTENDIGWVVPPGDAGELARIVRLAFSSEDPLRAERASTIAGRFNFAAAMASYSVLIHDLRRNAG